ncbi:hypothetical protein C5C31_14400 [Rathayibacter rathayi]|uniref:Uncharacterized protein n=2 Tax=Rathayibacter rathayi TaxID=33887 RepID=A0ABD6W913_RATRA|nr:hypothetical protein [Rathayibacter rathayi]AZZ49787.1 hypothetical protein C1O28_11830 [Rathayibacter rathayi]MWV76074.1 hypothetical protein [Rathayibacter rathayi NCPPB 2980 = VKM Ac-1601]PPF14344.1 hypothetical protein C5C04_07020 [Rathayibacter rathayi]PPF46713.1 hypothetical protein C5C08_11225 [Rathayibacter rathayi]PPF78573.1 hypothetical protein C5C14_11015 [Rathayibacter rathayi]
MTKQESGTATSGAGIAVIAGLVPAAIIALALSLSSGSLPLPYINATNPLSSVAFTVLFYLGFAILAVNVDRLVRRRAETWMIAQRAVFAVGGLIAAGSFLWIPYLPQMLGS